MVPVTKIGVGMAVCSTWRRSDGSWQPLEMSSRQLFVKKWHEVSPGKSGFGNCQQITPFKAMKWIASWEKVQKKSRRGLRGKPWDTPTLRSLVHRNETQMRQSGLGCGRKRR